MAESSNADTIIWGQYVKFGDQIRIDANIQSLKSGQTTAVKAETSKRACRARSNPGRLHPQEPGALY